MAKPRFAPLRTLQDMENEMAQLRVAHAMFCEDNDWPAAYQCLNDLVRVSAEHERLGKYLAWRKCQELQKLEERLLELAVRRPFVDVD